MSASIEVLDWLEVGQRYLGKLWPQMQGTRIRVHVSAGLRAMAEKAMIGQLGPQNSYLPPGTLHRTL